MLSRINSNESNENLDRVFRALGDPTRRAILAALATQDAMVTELAKPFDMSLPAVGKHLRVLERAGLIKRTIDGRMHRCALRPRPLKDADEWLGRYAQFWGESLDGLGDFLNQPSK